MPYQFKVTVGLPTYSRADLAVRALESCLAQTYGNLEIVVSDDVSADDTWERISCYQDSRLVTHRQAQNIGLVRNFDFCLHSASGDLFLLLGDDDVLAPDAIETLARPFEQPSGDDIGLSWCPCHIDDAEGAPQWVTKAGPECEEPSRFLAALWAGERGPRFSSIMIRTADALSVGGYQTRYGDLCDIGNYGQVALLHRQVVCSGRPLVRYTNHARSVTRNSTAKQWREWAVVVHRDLLLRAQASGNSAALTEIRDARTDFLGGITATVLMQGAGRPGWIQQSLRESLGPPFLLPYMLKRLWKDRNKIARLARRPTE